MPMESSGGGGRKAFKESLDSPYASMGGGGRNMAPTSKGKDLFFQTKVS